MSEPASEAPRPRRARRPRVPSATGKLRSVGKENRTPPPSMTAASMDEILDRVDLPRGYRHASGQMQEHTAGRVDAYGQPAQQDRFQSSYPDPTLYQHDPATGFANNSTEPALPAEPTVQQQPPITAGFVTDAIDPALLAGSAVREAVREQPTSSYNTTPTTSVPHNTFSSTSKPNAGTPLGPYFTPYPKQFHSAFADTQANDYMSAAWEHFMGAGAVDSATADHGVEQRADVLGNTAATLEQSANGSTSIGQYPGPTATQLQPPYVAPSNPYNVSPAQRHAHSLEQEVESHGVSGVSEVPELPRSWIPELGNIRRVDDGSRVRKDADVQQVQGQHYVKVNNSDTYAPAIEFNTINQWNEDLDQTTPAPGQEDWTDVRGEGRPNILYVLKPVGQYAYKTNTGRNKKKPLAFRPAVDAEGRVLLNPEKQPMRHSDHLPLTVSTKIEGWRVEAVVRLDPDVTHDDFVDRMPLQRTNGKCSRPSNGTLNTRRSRARRTMRILPWPLPNTLSYVDEQVVRELDDWGRMHNSTRGLEDLTKDQIVLQDKIMYGNKLERGRTGARTDEDILIDMKRNLADVQRQGYGPESEEIRTMQSRIQAQENKVNPTQELEDDANLDLSNRKRKRSIEPELSCSRKRRGVCLPPIRSPR